jgi:hypothetical protein
VDSIALVGGKMRELSTLGGLYMQLSRAGGYRIVHGELKTMLGRVVQSGNPTPRWHGMCGGISPGQPCFLVTETGVGYHLRPDDD